MTVRNLERLLAPRSIAIVGASDRAGSVGSIVAANVLAGGFRGSVYLVNPARAEVAGRRCWPSLAALPEAPDLAIVMTPPPTVPDVIAELGRRGTKAAVVITAGVRGELRQRMLDAARPHLLRIQGPNCLGLMLPGRGLDASFASSRPLAGKLAFLSQSGALITGIVDWAATRSIGFSHVVSMGDMADVDFGDMLDFLAGDAASQAILLYVEAVTQAQKFLSAARRAARAKPVIVIKGGRRAAGARAALSHTGALAGSDAAYDAAFRRAGLLRVFELSDLFAAAETLARLPIIAGDRLAILTNGGGAGVMAADRLTDDGGRLAPLGEATMAALERVLPATWSRANPVDIIGDAGPDRYRAGVSALIAEPEADALLVISCPTALASSEAAADAVIAEVEMAREGPLPARPVLTCWLGGDGARPARSRFALRQIPTFDTPAEAINGFMQIVRYSSLQAQLMATPPPAPEPPAAGRDTIRAVIKEALDAGRSVLSELEAKRVLAAAGLPVAEARLAATPAEVEAEAARLLADHTHVVLKIVSDDIPHKSDFGGVKLDIPNALDAARAAGQMLARIRELRPQARLKGFSVQPMIRRKRAHELIAGITVDQTFGPLVLFGAGGTAVEVVRDTALALPPLDMRLARSLMRETRVHRLLEGYRDRPPADLDAIALALVRLASLAAVEPAIREIDINPLLADDKGVIVLDARMRIADPVRHPRTAMAIRPYPAEWERRARLASGGEVVLRPIRPEDEALYDTFFRHVSRDDMRLRFFTPQPDLSHRFLARLTQIDYAREMAFVAIEAATGALLGVSRFIADPDYVKGEYAVLVRSDLKGVGLGWLLMEHLLAYARAEGIAEIHGAVLAENTVMLRMCQDLGFTIAPDPSDPTVRIVKIKLA
jgi:acetyltransferase